MYFPYKIKYFIMFGLILSIAGCDRKSQITEPDEELSPAVPSGLRIYSANDGLIGLEWLLNNEANLKGYNLYRSINDTTGFIFIGFTSEDYFIDDSLNYDSTYYYYIKAIDFDNQESSASITVAGTPLNKLTPFAPRDLQVNARNWDNRQEIFLWWARGRESDLKGYNIYRSLNSSFTADSSTFHDFTTTSNYTDKKGLEQYQIYYYKISALDNGGLESNTGNEVSDLILEAPVLIFPVDKSQVDYFEKFKVMTVDIPAVYKIILQSNQFFGEVWSSEFRSSVTNDTVDVNLSYRYLERNKTYYWRVVTYSENSAEPNSISNLFSFTIKP